MHTRRCTSSLYKTTSIEGLTFLIFHVKKSGFRCRSSLRESFHRIFLKYVKKCGGICFSATGYSTLRFFVTESVMNPSISSHKISDVEDTVTANRCNVSTISLAMFFPSSKAKHNGLKVNFWEWFGGERIFKIKEGQSPSIRFLFVVSKWSIALLFCQFVDQCQCSFFFSLNSQFLAFLLVQRA